MCLCEYSDCLIEETTGLEGRQWSIYSFKRSAVEIAAHWSLLTSSIFGLVSTLHNTYSYVVEIGVGGAKGCRDAQKLLIVLG